jgi:hypothetical protein
MKLLFLQSGGVCAFPECNRTLVEPGNKKEAAAILGEMAHIVADSRQGPRGDAGLNEEARNKAGNLILFCGDHHKLVDSQPRTFSVPVLQQIKRDHENRIKNLTQPGIKIPPPPLIKETLHSTLLPLTHVPSLVFSAPCHFDEIKELRQAIDYSKSKGQSVPYYLSGKTLFAFHDLRKENGPFHVAVDKKLATATPAQDFWTDAEGKRKYVSLLNRSLRRHAGLLSISFDPLHYRYYFKILEPGKEREVSYRPLNAARTTRKVVWQPIRKRTGEPKNFWWHLAVGLKFIQMEQRQWHLSVRPERHLTRDGLIPLDPDQIGRRVTSLKAKMYNDIYLKEVNFWRDFLSAGQPRIYFNYGDQNAVIDARFLNVDVSWPGIQGDEKPFKNQVAEEDLFTLADLFEAVSGDENLEDEAEDHEEA